MFDKRWVESVITRSIWVGLLSQFPPFRYFPTFSELPKYWLPIEYHIHIWQMSPQLSCGDICQIWMWFEESSVYFCKIENLANGETNERSFSNPHPCSVILACPRGLHTWCRLCFLYVVCICHCPALWNIGLYFRILGKYRKLATQFVHITRAVCKELMIQFEMTTNCWYVFLEAWKIVSEMGASP